MSRIYRIKIDIDPTGETKLTRQTISKTMKKTLTGA
jgi:hypothetical protein